MRLSTFLLLSLSLLLPVSAQKKKERPASSAGESPDLSQYYINLKTSPRSQQTKPVVTSLPLNLVKGDRIALIGSGVLDNARHHGFFETLLHQRHPRHELSVRNFSWPADEIDLQPRPANFGDLDQHLTYYRTDVIFAAFGYNESFAGSEGLPAFKARFNAFLAQIKSRAYNGTSGARIIVLSPIANEDVNGVAAGERNNENLKLYTAAMSEIAAKKAVAFVDVFGATALAMAEGENDLTTNGNQLNQNGQLLLAKTLYRQLFGETAPEANEAIRQLVVDKSDQF
ncbi:MAG: SGNH/GDSL hydrolase family protein, partial [Roseibacillus sp.]